MSAIVVSAIYCDDIRHEVGGKQSFMGVYNSELLVPDFPASIPKLCATVTVRVPTDTPIGDLEVRVILNETVLAKAPFPPEHIANINGPALEAAKTTGSEWIVAMLVLEFLPLQVQTEGRMTLRAYSGGEEIKGNGLWIRKQTIEEQRQYGAATPPKSELNAAS